MNKTGVNSLNRVRSISTIESELRLIAQEFCVNSLNRVRSISTHKIKTYSAAIAHVSIPLIGYAPFLLR